jgi:hypothetical protein
MKTIFTIFAITLSINSFAQDKRQQVSVSSVVNGCKQGSDSICKTITASKSFVENTVKNSVPTEISSTTIFALKIITDNGIKINNTLLSNDHILIQPNQIAYGITVSF